MMILQTLPLEQRKMLNKINTLKRNLQLTDYQAIKFAEGELTEEEFAPIREQRRLWRVEINRLAEEFAQLRNS